MKTTDILEMSQQIMAGVIDRWIKEYIKTHGLLPESREK